MFKAWVPIREDDIIESIKVVESTAFYILEQSYESLFDLYKNQQNFFLFHFNVLTRLIASIQERL